MEKVKYFPTIEAIDKASEVLGEILEPTPFMKNNNLSDVYEANVFLKREDLQMVRSYKIRGAYNKIRSIDPETLKKGIVCASAGNHAQGVAFSCSKLQIIGSIFMPTTTPKQKIEQVKMFGKEFIEIVLTGDTFDAANSAAIAYAEENGFYLNDLYALVANSLDFPKSDYVHYTDEGAKRLGMHVADYLRKFL